MQRTGVLVAATLAVIVIGLPLTILLLLDPATSQASCGASASPGAADSTAGLGAGMQPVSGADWAAQINQLYPINGGRTLPADVIAALAESAGRTLGVDVPGETMAQVTIGESSQEPGSHGFDPNGVTQGYGLWSITTVYNDDLVAPFGGYGQMLNPIKNALVMAEIYRRQGIGAWYGTKYVTNWNQHYTGRLPLVNLKSVLGMPSSQTPFASTGSATGDCPAANGLVTGPVTPGTQSHILPNGLATIPQDAPVAVQRAISAGNRIIHTFYSQERRPHMLAQVQDSYDCSGSSAYVLYQARSQRLDRRRRQSDRRRFELDGGLRPARWRSVDHGVCLLGPRVHQGRQRRLRHRALRAGGAQQRPGPLPARRSDQRRADQRPAVAADVDDSLPAGRRQRLDPTPPLEPLMRATQSAATALLAAAVVGLTISGCGNSSAADHPASSSSPVKASSSAAPSRGLTQRVARGFAAAYARYLDGQLPAAALPDATAAARSQAGARLPAAARAGDLAVTSIRALPGHRSSVVAFSNRAHRFSAHLTVAPRPRAMARHSGPGARSGQHPAPQLTDPAYSRIRRGQRRRARVSQRISGPGSSAVPQPQPFTTTLLSLPRNSGAIRRGSRRACVTSSFAWWRSGCSPPVTAGPPWPTSPMTSKPTS